MADNTATSPYESMKYNELKAAAAERGLDASGTKEDLIARLTEADTAGTSPASKTGEGASSASEAGNEGDKGDKPEAPQPPQRPQPRTAQSAPAPTPEQLHHSKAMRQKAYLDKQPKVMVLVPFEAGENPEQGKTIPFHCSINGYTYDIPRGVMIEVPMDVAQIVRERLESEGRIGREHRLDADAARAAALE